MTRMSRTLALGAAGLVAAGSLVGARSLGQGARAATQGAAESFARAQLIVEVNGTDGDAGLQVFLDGGPWRAVTIYGTDGREILEYQTRGQVRDYGMTELFSESSEPPFTTFPLEDFMALFPEGEYRFVGRTIDGVRIVGTATLSHDLPVGPEIVRPGDGETVSSDGTRIRWRPAAQPAGVEIVGYQVTLEREDPLRIFSVDLPADARGVRVPGAYIEPGVEYSAEVLAVDASGNQTLTSITMFTA